MNQSMFDVLYELSTGLNYYNVRTLSIKDNEIHVNAYPLQIYDLMFSLRHITNRYEVLITRGAEQITIIHLKKGKKDRCPYYYTTLPSHIAISLFEERNLEYIRLLDRLLFTMICIYILLKLCKLRNRMRQLI